MLEMNRLDDFIKEIEAVENMYLDKKHILKRLKAISKENKPKIKGFGIPYDAMSDGLKSSIDIIEEALSKTNKREIKDTIICSRVNRTDNNRCINCGSKSGHECQLKPNKSDYC